MRGKNVTVVVDGGGSGCRLGAYDTLGKLCATAVDGPASLSLGEEQAWQHISRGINSLAEQLGESNDWLPSELCMGLSGSLQTSRRELFLALLPQSIKVTLITDGRAQLLGASGGKPGACLALGTGSVLHWIDSKGHVGMAGGWGYPLGDEGSGAWLGAQLINAYLWHRDSGQIGSGAPDIFSVLEDRIGNEVSDVQLWSTSTRSTDLASLAPIVVSCAKQGDVFAQSLLQRGADQCARLLCLAPDSLPVYVVGGLAGVYDSWLEQSIQARMHIPEGDVFSGLFSLSLTHERISS